jgi:hypothetical protein
MEETQYGYTLTIPTLKQRHAERLAELYSTFTSKPPVVFNGDLTRIAADFGWLAKTARTDPDDAVAIGTVKPEQVAEMFPNVVQWATRLVSDSYRAAFDIPGE